MVTYSNAVRHLSNSKCKEFNKKFTNKIALEIWGDDSCCDSFCCCYDDDDYLSDEQYEWSYEYMEKRSHLFYENISSLKTVFTTDFLDDVKARQSAEIDALTVYLKVKAKDLIEGYNSEFFAEFFDEGNKYNLELYAMVNYKDFDLTKIRSIDIAVMNPFNHEEGDSYGMGRNSMYKFNVYYEKHTNIMFSTIAFFYKNMQRREIPEWCETMEETIMYMYLDAPQYKKLKEIFDIKEVIKDISMFDVLKMYMV
jgi:hypothetical protein